MWPWLFVNWFFHRSIICEQMIRPLFIVHTPHTCRQGGQGEQSPSPTLDPRSLSLKNSPSPVSQKARLSPLWKMLGENFGNLGPKNTILRVNPLLPPISSKIVPTLRPPCSLEKKSPSRMFLYTSKYFHHSNSHLHFSSLSKKKMSKSWYLQSNFTKK